MSLVGSIDYSKIAEILEQLDILYMGNNISIPPNGEITLPSDKGIEVSKYRTKTINLVVDYPLEYWIEISEDGTNWFKYINFSTENNIFTSVFTGNPFTGEVKFILLTNVVNVITVRDDCKYIRIRIKNPEYIEHKIIQCVIKGKRI